MCIMYFMQMIWFELYTKNLIMSEIPFYYRNVAFR